MTKSQIQRELRALADPQKASFFQKFFRTGPGEYAEGDKFLGLSVPQMRSVAKKASQLPLNEAIQLLQSPWHEDRLVALIILVEQFRKSDQKAKSQIFKAYLKNRKFINNWDLVDSSASQIVGATLFDQDRSILYQLAKSKSLWDRRIAVLSTFYFIRQNDFSDTLKISELLLNDQEDLIHKATGWMLREAGKKNPRVLRRFLDSFAHQMPRTMLRYSIEKLSLTERRKYMRKKQPRT